MLTLTYPSTLTSNYQVPFIDIRDKLPINPNYTWAQLAGVRETDVLNTIVCHHDAIPKKSSEKYNDLQIASRIATAHINSKKNHANGDAGFPYDIWIRNGNIYWCNDIEQREYGVKGNNGYTVNVCVSGDYHNFDTLTDADRKALYVAIMMLKEAMPNDKFLKGHNELQATNCPGYSMNQVRTDIAALEEQLQYNESPNRAREEIFASVTRVNDLYAKYINKDGKYSEAIQREAERKLHGKLFPALKENGFL